MPALHLTDVSDAHSVASHPVCPSRPRPVYAVLPMPAPCTVIDADTPAPRFAPCITLSPGTSVVHACVRLPDPSPAVTTARLDPCTPVPTLHLTDVSDTHSVASHPVCPSRPRPVYAVLPMLAPCTVIDADTSASRFVPCITLSPSRPRPVYAVLPMLGTGAGGAHGMRGDGVGVGHIGEVQGRDRKSVV